jgi:hypothetical protein
MIPRCLKSNKVGHQAPDGEAANRRIFIAHAYDAADVLRSKNASPWKNAQAIAICSV